jgi:hypothetical protein
VFFYSCLLFFLSQRYENGIQNLFNIKLNKNYLVKLFQYLVYVNFDIILILFQIYLNLIIYNIVTLRLSKKTLSNIKINEMEDEKKMNEEQSRLNIYFRLIWYWHGKQDGNNDWTDYNLCRITIKLVWNINSVCSVLHSFSFHRSSHLFLCSTKSSSKDETSQYCK